MNLIAYLVIFVGQYVSQTDHGSPRYVGKGVARFYRQTPCRLADNLKSAFHGAPEHSIRKKLLETPSLGKLDGRPRGVQHIP